MRRREFMTLIGGERALTDQSFFGLYLLHFSTRTTRAKAGSDDLSNTKESAMNSNYKSMLCVLVGTALGAAAMQGLHAQTKPKAYTVSELETIDAAAQAAFAPVIQAERRAASGRPFRTGGGRVVAIEGGPAPQRVAITEWDNLEQAVAFYNSAAWKNLAPQRDKAIKTIRRYAVEAIN